MITIPKESVNNILGILHENENYLGWEVIDDEMLDNNEDLPKELLGYKFKIKQHGSHYHDGQIVDYTFKFKSPSGLKTKFKTHMCLAISWNHRGDDLTIN